MAMTTPHYQRRQWYWYGLQLEMTHFIQPYRHATITKICYNTQIHTQHIQLKWLPIIVAIVTDYVFTSNTESPHFQKLHLPITNNINTTVLESRITHASDKLPLVLGEYCCQEKSHITISIVRTHSELPEMKISDQLSVLANICL